MSSTVSVMISANSSRPSNTKSQSNWTQHLTVPEMSKQPANWCTLKWPTQLALKLLTKTQWSSLLLTEISSSMILTGIHFSSKAFYPHITKDIYWNNMHSCCDHFKGMKVRSNLSGMNKYFNISLLKISALVTVYLSIVQTISFSHRPNH